MPTFQYRALESSGAISEGVIEAGGRQEAFRLMEDKGLRPVSLAEKANGKARGFVCFTSALLCKFFCSSYLPGFATLDIRVTD